MKCAPVILYATLSLPFLVSIGVICFIKFFCLWYDDKSILVDILSRLLLFFFKFPFVFYGFHRNCFH